MKDYNCELIGDIVSVEENPEGSSFYIDIRRATDKHDIIPIDISREVMGDIELNPEMTVRILGIIRTHRIKGSYKSHLRVEAHSIQVATEEMKHKNIVFGRFEVKDSKSTRSTMTGSKIKDIILKQVLSSDLSVSEFRALLWNNDAETYTNVVNGTELYIIGRLQSREYTRKTLEGISRVRTYEVSIGKVEDDTDKYAEDL